MTHDLDLMQRADGELAEPAAEAIDAELAHDAVARDKVEAIGHTAEVVRSHLELAADAVPAAKFDAMWSQIEKVLDHAVEPPTARLSWGKRVGQWFDRYRGHIFTGVVSAGAVAALALVLRPGTDDGTATNLLPVVHRPAEIESLDTPAGNGTVLSLQDEDGATTVIWVTPEDSVESI